MAFRQQNKTPDKIWRKLNRSRLIAAGIPDLVVDDERRWTYVLLHGDDEFGSGWNLSWITNDQAAELLRLLEARYEHEPLLNDLRRRLRK